jgi:hypothetical protein
MTLNKYKIDIVYRILYTVPKLGHWLLGLVLFLSLLRWHTPLQTRPELVGSGGCDA